MYSTEPEPSKATPLRRWLKGILHLLGSLKLAVPLLATLAAVIAVATVLEANHGRAYAQWYVYHSAWFTALLVLLGVNILFATIIRWPWKRRHTGFLVTHCGLLILLTGSIQSFLGSVEGQVTLAEGESTTKMTLPQQSQITATWVGQGDAPYEFTFEPGPVDWREGKTLNLGAVDGLSARVLHFYRHARAVEQWVADDSGLGGPVVKLKLEGPRTSGSVEQTLVDQDYGDEVFAGPILLRLQRAVSGAMLQDFLKPPTQLGKNGVLVAYYQNQVKRITVDDSIGKTIGLDSSGAVVQVVKYMPNARPDAHGHFQSAGQDPRNPVLELQVSLPDHKQPLRQLAFAKSPLLNLDAVYGKVCPVRFHYYHPAVKPATAVEFLQAKDHTLYWRVFANDRLVTSGKTEPGRRVELPGKFGLAIAEHLPHAREKIVFEPVPDDSDQAEKAEAAAEVAIAVGGVEETLWLQRNHDSYGTRTVVTPEGTLRVRFGSAEAPLGFSLRLVKFQRGKNPGGVGNASFASVVQLSDKLQGVDDERTISMNEPLMYNGLRFYQSGFNDNGQGAESSTFSVAHDPGRPLKYSGCLMICLGIGIMFYMRAYFFKNVPKRPGRWFGFGRSAAPTRGDAEDQGSERASTPSGVPETPDPECAVAVGGGREADQAVNT